MDTNRLAVKRLTLRAKLIGLCLLITTVLGGSTVFLMQNMVRTSEKNILKAFESHATALADSIAAQFYERYGDVQAFALNRILQSRSKSEIVDAFNTYTALYGIYDLILFVDAEGDLIATNSKGPDGKEVQSDQLYKKNFAQTQWFKQVMGGGFTEDKGKGFVGTYVEDFQIDPMSSLAYGRPIYGTAFSAAVKNTKGEVIGVITNRAGSRWVEVAFQEAYTALKSQDLKSSRLSLVKTDGTFLLDHFPTANNGSNDVDKNFDKLLKFSLKDAGFTAADTVLKHSKGNLVAPSWEDGTPQGLGFTVVSGKKFIDSIGWKVIVQESHEELLSDINRSKRTFYVIFFLLTVCGTVASYYFANGISRVISEITQGLSSGADQIMGISQEIAASGGQISESTREQASALQETSSAATEINAMVERNAENARRSEERAQSSQTKIREGKKAIEEMSISMQGIAQANDRIIAQVQKANSDFNQVVKIITEIGSKTQVIHDIVFKTQLLSFNASVEAARAGEHGKGFSVVAEEVGNLARMSGSAANEIGGLLEQSTEKVRQIVESSRSSVESLVENGRRAIADGNARANRCDEVFNSILQDSTSVCAMVSEIAASSREQSQGVQEVTQAMGHLDQTTHESASAATRFAKTAQLMAKQATHLRSLLGQLETMIRGDDRMAAPKWKDSAAPPASGKRAA